MLGTEEIFNQIGLLSYGGIGVLAFLAKFLIILPEETVLLAFGYLSGSPSINIYKLIPIVFLGTFLSDFLIYSLARRHSEFIDKIYNKLFASHLSSKMEWIGSNIKKVVFFSRFLMQLRILGPILAGKMNMRAKSFLLTNFFASVIYVPFYIILGYYFRSRIEAIFSGIGVLRNVLITLVVIIIVIFVIKLLRKKFYNLKVFNPNEQ